MPKLESARPTDPGDTCLVLFLKCPSRAKRRLAAELGDASAAAAARLLRCAFEDLSAWAGTTVLAPADAADLDWLAAELGPRSPVVLQRGDSLGNRINHVDAELRGSGIDRSLFIGSDCPTLDCAYLREAAAALDDFDAVLGPAADGGVVVMGNAQPWPELGSLPWSTGRLRERLLDLLKRQGWKVAELEQRRDVDTLDDLLSALRQLRDDPRPARRALCLWAAGEAQLRGAGP
jgi:hypothetical protein